MNDILLFCLCSFDLYQISFVKCEICLKCKSESTKFIRDIQYESWKVLVVLCLKQTTKGFLVRLSWKKVLLIVECKANSQQQSHLINLLKCFGSKIETKIISQTWKKGNQFYFEAGMKLMEICSASNVNEFKEKNELKVIREMCLHILWNILKYPKNTKYRQISNQSLYNNLKWEMPAIKYRRKSSVVNMTKHLQKFGFQRVNNEDWYDQIDVNLLWL
ncbi:hypothetical protein RFI_27521 [Reticulomyxa filosa]|uniref:Uncharacterized protein n=1 Tax=Reticulomyxa filosa TaxID=46433 RepID=X6M8A1_RETFI|nr:hypothetical protein RFI_27521 [Reticulomyxa filosa]|eukprot:ETO09856.1 hypothetical protein RFI_27521 [Reticulomyxa filosa]